MGQPIGNIAMYKQPAINKQSVSHAKMMRARYSSPTLRMVGVRQEERKNAKIKFVNVIRPECLSRDAYIFRSLHICRSHAWLGGALHPSIISNDTNDEHRLLHCLCGPNYSIQQQLAVGPFLYIRLVFFSFLYNTSQQRIVFLFLLSKMMCTIKMFLLLLSNCSLATSKTAAIKILCREGWALFLHNKWMCCCMYVTRWLWKMKRSLCGRAF
jgi:hypothetical protein